MRYACHGGCWIVVVLTLDSLLNGGWPWQAVLLSVSDLHGGGLRVLAVLTRS
jgi:hypothetical protein